MKLAVRGDAGPGVMQRLGTAGAIVAGLGLMWMSGTREAPGAFALLGTGLIAAVLLAAWIRGSHEYVVTGEQITIHHGPFLEQIRLDEILEARALESNRGGVPRIALRLRSSPQRQRVLTPVRPLTILFSIAEADAHLRWYGHGLRRTTWSSPAENSRRRSPVMTPAAEDVFRIDYVPSLHVRM